MIGPQLILFFGALTYLLLLLTVLSGKRIIRINMKWHRRTGLVALLTASTHLAIVLYYKLLIYLAE